MAKKTSNWIPYDFQKVLVVIPWDSLKNKKVFGRDP
jgi:hypothetical protein